MTLILCAGASTAATAGSYTVSYSGGTATSDILVNSYALEDDENYTGYAWAQWGSGEDTVTSGSAKCEGEITATFTWEPDANETAQTDPPPFDIVIAENGNIDVMGSPDGVVTAGADNDLGFPYTGSDFTNGGYGNCDGTRYKIKNNPGMSFTITSSPSAHIEGTGVANQSSSGYGYVVVRYKATALPLEIILSGGIGLKNNKSFLVGQLVTGTLTTGGLAASGFNWSVSGGEPFKDWGPTQAENTATTFLGYSGDTTSQTSFCFRKYTGSGATVSCSLHLAVPSGALPAAGFNVNLSRTCAVDKPSNTLSIYMGTVEPISAFYFPNYTSPSAIQLLSNTPSAADPYCYGIQWTGTVTTPIAYGSGGGWNYTQLVTPHRVLQSSGVQNPFTLNGVKVLDTTFGYEPVYTATAVLFLADGTTHVEGDAPAQDWGSAAYLDVLDSFITYTLYRPPGSGSQFAPLKNLNWYWQGHAQKNASNSWQLSNTNAQWSFLDDFPTHPMWQHNVTEGHF